MTEREDYAAWFAEYAALLTRSIRGRADVRAFRDKYEKAFIASGPSEVATARNSWLLGLIARRAAAFHRKVGTLETRVRFVETRPLFEGHDAVRVAFDSDHATRDGTLTLPFEITYLMRRGGDGRVRIFGFIGDDEMEIYRAYGLVDASGRPTDKVDSRRPRPDGHGP